MGLQDDGFLLFHRGDLESPSEGTYIRTNMHQVSCRFAPFAPAIHPSLLNVTRAFFDVTICCTYA